MGFILKAQVYYNLLNYVKPWEYEVVLKVPGYLEQLVELAGGITGFSITVGVVTSFKFDIDMADGIINWWML